METRPERETKDIAARVSAEFAMTAGTTEPHRGYRNF